MPAAHRHNDVELNFVERGSVVYLFGGNRATIPAGQVLAFWAAAPHQMVEVAPDAHMHWLTLSLAWLLHRPVPDEFARMLLSGRPLLAPMQAGDSHVLDTWQRDLVLGGDWRAIMMLEVEARLRRFAACVAPAPVAAAPANVSRHKAEAMARVIAQRFDEPLAIGDIAATVKLHPNYAMKLFRCEFGLTINEYLVQQRVARAQQLLITTDDDVLDVAMQAGFGSSSQFYLAFKRVCGMSPREHRATLR
jgi:AraC-like DNA-binding protein